MKYEDQIYEIYAEIRKGIPNHKLIRTVFLNVLRGCKKRYEDENATQKA